MGHLEGNSLLHNLQYGFWYMRSCETQLLQFVDDLIIGVCDGDQFDSTIIDFSTVFNVVPHVRAPISNARALWNKQQHPVA